MNRETQEALERLSRELLAEDAPEEMPEEDFLDGLDELLADADDIAEDSPEIYRNFSNGYGRSVRAYNADRTDREAEALSDELETPERRRSAAPLLLPLVLLFAAAVALAWWAVNYL